MRRSACSSPAVDSGTLSEGDLTENEIAAKAAGPPCMCQKAPLSAVAMLSIGLFMLAISRIPPYLNRDKHMLQLVRVLAHSSLTPTPSLQRSGLSDIPASQGKSGRKWPCWCLTCRWMRQCEHLSRPSAAFGGHSRPVLNADFLGASLLNTDNEDDVDTICCGGSSESIATGSPTLAHQV